MSFIWSITPFPPSPLYLRLLPSKRFLIPSYSRLLEFPDTEQELNSYFNNWLNWFTATAFFCFLPLMLKTVMPAFLIHFRYHSYPIVRLFPRLEDRFALPDSQLQGRDGRGSHYWIQGIAIEQASDCAYLSTDASSTNYDSCSWYRYSFRQTRVMGGERWTSYLNFNR